nr:basic proline-rich protein-like [Aegilops tauschii subsp. strangulata]
MAPALPLLAVSTSSVRPHAAVPRRPRQRRRPSPRLRPRPAFLSLDDACGLAAPLQPPWCASPSRPPEPAASATLAAFRPSWLHAWRRLGPQPSGWGAGPVPEAPAGSPPTVACVGSAPPARRLRVRPASSRSRRLGRLPDAGRPCPRSSRRVASDRRLRRLGSARAPAPRPPGLVLLPALGPTPRRWPALHRFLPVPASPRAASSERPSASPARPSPRPTTAPAPDGLACSPAAPADYGSGARRPRLLARRPVRLRLRCQTALPARPPPRPTAAPAPDGLACSPAAPADYGSGARRPRRLARRPGRLRPRRQTASPARPPPRPTTAPAPDSLACRPASVRRAAPLPPTRLRLPCARRAGSPLAGPASSAMGLLRSAPARGFAYTHARRLPDLPLQGMVLSS